MRSPICLPLGLALWVRTDCVGACVVVNATWLNHFQFPLVRLYPRIWNQEPDFHFASSSGRSPLGPGLSSVQFSRSVVSDSPRPHELQHARPPCPSPTPGVHSDSHPLSQWCHPAISSSVVPFSSCLQSLPASESFPMSQLVAWGGQSTGVSALASFLPKKCQGWSQGCHYFKRNVLCRGGIQ